MIATSWAEWVKYNPHWADQPRVPAGQPEGGQWSQGGSDGGSGGAEGGNGQGTGGDAHRPAPGHTTPPTTARDHVPPGTFGHTKNFTWDENLMTESEKDEALKTIKELFGPHVPVEHVLSLAGTLDGSKVALSAGGYGGTKVLTIMHESPEIERDPNTHEITKGHVAVRELYVEADGRRYLHNDLFMGPGKGLDMFGRQVEAATQYGIGHIETAASGDGDPKTGKADGRFNGYYTWPRFGYDADLDRKQLEKVPDHLKPQVQAAGGRVSGLMATKEGRDWWRGNGSELEAKFDLTPGSYSQRTFNAYLRERERIKASWVEWLKYNPNWADQPRVPAGQPEGGQWAGGDAGGSGGGSPTEPTPTPTPTPPPSTPARPMWVVAPTRVPGHSFSRDTVDLNDHDQLLGDRVRQMVKNLHEKIQDGQLGPAHPGTVAEVGRIGKMIYDHVYSKMPYKEEEINEHYQRAQELRDAQDVAEMRGDREKAQEYHTAKRAELDAADSKSIRNRYMLAKRVAEVLPHIRDMGPGDTKQNFHEKTDELARTSVDKQLQHLPKDWAQASADHNTLHVALEHVRAGYTSMDADASGPHSRIVTQPTKEGVQSTLLHEIGHRMEDVVPGLKDVNNAWRFKRQTESNEQDTSPIYGNDKEQGYRDKFADHYVGRVYNSGDTEVLSMGLEGLFHQRHGIARKDPGHLQHTLGILASF